MLRVLASLDHNEVCSQNNLQEIAFVLKSSPTTSAQIQRILITQLNLRIFELSILPNQEFFDGLPVHSRASSLP